MFPYEKIQRQMKMRRFLQTLRSHGKPGLSFLLIAAMLCSVFLPYGSELGEMTAKAAETQTASKNVEEFQRKKFAEIQNAVFGGSVGENGVTSTTDLHNSDKSLKPVISGNKYFNWTETGLKKCSAEGIVQNTNNYPTASRRFTVDDITYYVIDVSDPDDLYNTLYWTGSKNTDAKVYYNSSTLTSANYNFIINITADLDMNGAERCWNPIQVQTTNPEQHICIEGNGHTIYILSTENI